MRNWHQPQQLLTRKKNMRLKKSGSTENKTEGYSTSYIERVMKTNIINGLQKQGYPMQKR